LHSEWTLNPQYSYGWGVPFLGIIMLLRRWRERPAAEPAVISRRAGVLAFLGLICWLPIRVIREANMDWRFLEWIISGAAVCYLSGLFYVLGGRSYAKHFAFPILFLLVAVPWPTRIESLIVHGLTGFVIKGAVEALRWMGVAAW